MHSSTHTLAQIERYIQQMSRIDPFRVAHSLPQAFYKRRLFDVRNNKYWWIVDLFT